MTTTTPSHNLPTQQPGFLDWLRTFVRRLLGGSSTSAASASATAYEARDASDSKSESDYIIAPGGFRIRRPQSVDPAGKMNITSFNDLLPEVREGLSLLPPLPTVVLELLREIQSTTSTASSVAEIASSDPSLAASLLRAVNSAAFGLPHKVTSVSQAVSLLGFAAVRVMVVRFRLEAMLPASGVESAALSEDIWTHSLTVSYVAAALAARVPELDRGFISTLGLLHDIGRLALCSQHPDFVAALRKVSAGDSLLSSEASAFGADHAAVGAMLGNRWKLPADLNTAIRWHHAPASAFEATDPPALRKSVHLVHLADQLAKFCFSYSEDMEIDLPTEEAMAMLSARGSLTQLLDTKVRTAATQAILYADENTRRPLTIVRPFLNLRRGAAASDLCKRLQAQTSAPLVSEGSAGNDLIEASEKTFEFDSARTPPSVTGLPSARYCAPATAAAADWLIKSLSVRLQSAAVPARTAGTARAVVRALLPNLLSSEDTKIDVAAHWESPTLHVAIRCTNMAFAARLPAGADSTLGRRVVEAELANILNLAWFDAETSSDGATLLLRSRP